MTAENKMLCSKNLFTLNPDATIEMGVMAVSGSDSSKLQGVTLKVYLYTGGFLISFFLNFEWSRVLAYIILRFNARLR